MLRLGFVTLAFALLVPVFVAAQPALLLDLGVASGGETKP